MAIYFTPTDTAPTSTTGGLYYDNSEKGLKHYNGTTWAPMDGKRTNTDRPGDGQYTSDEYTALLIHSNTTHGSTTFTDSGNTGHTITRVGNIDHDANQKKIGSTSILFDNPSSTAMYLTIPNHADWNFGTGDFTMDCWVRVDTTGQGGYGSLLSFTNIANSTNSIQNWRFNGTTSPFFLEGTTAYHMTNNVSAGTWTHLAVAREGTTLRFFKDGVLDSTHTGNSINYQSLGTGIHIGNSWQGYAQHAWDGYIDEFRISKGIARWNQTFTVYPQ